MPQAGFGLRISKDERPQPYALDCVATGTGVGLELRKGNTIAKKVIMNQKLFFHSDNKISLVNIPCCLEN
jgi:hypothetical protein